MLALTITVSPPAVSRDSAGDQTQDDLSVFAGIAASERADFARRSDWVKLVDRLAWQGLLQGDVATLSNHYLIPRRPAELGVSWCEAWQNYLVAAVRYCRPNLVIADLSAHQTMLLDLGGNVFCMLPGVDWSLRRAIAHLGALDRFFADLGRLDDDARLGRCAFPRDVLARFGLTPRHFADASYRCHPGYAALLRFWLDCYLPTLRAEAAELCQMTDLPEPLRLLRERLRAPSCAHRAGVPWRGVARR